MIALVFGISGAMNLFFIFNIIPMNDFAWGSSMMTFVFITIWILLDWLEYKNKRDNMYWEAWKEAREWKKYLKALKKQLLKKDDDNFI